ncbi:MAG: hypothetical protein H6631_01010 [Anaerolineaceae bacterium]|nr:hypothetical protein [Anaerolineaceae bacterium]
MARLFFPLADCVDAETLKRNPTAFFTPGASLTVVDEAGASGSLTYDAYGGVPTVPQSLNRYVATSLGATGGSHPRCPLELKPYPTI